MKTQTQWLELATSTKREKFAVIHGNVGTDGFRLHRDNSLPAAENDPFLANIYDCGIIPTRPRNRATISRLDLLDACKRAYALRDEWDRKNKKYPDLRFSMNGAFTYSAHVESIGTISAEIVDGLKVTDKVSFALKANRTTYHTHTMTYKHHNPEKCVDFALNPKYLMDALEGMDTETIEIDIPAYNAPFYMTDGTHEAVIMPISIK